MPKSALMLVAEPLIAPKRQGQKITVEIKSFAKRSIADNFYSALGLRGYLRSSERHIERCETSQSCNSTLKLSTCGKRCQSAALRPSE
jgi:hypothetical protein